MVCDTWRQTWFATRVSLNYHTGSVCSQRPFMNAAVHGCVCDMEREVSLRQWLANSKGCCCCCMSWCTSTAWTCRHYNFFFESEICVKESDWRVFFVLRKTSPRSRKLVWKSCPLELSMKKWQKKTLAYMCGLCACRRETQNSSLFSFKCCVILLLHWDLLLFTRRTILTLHKINSVSFHLNDLNIRTLSCEKLSLGWLDFLFQRCGCDAWNFCCAFVICRRVTFE